MYNEILDLLEKQNHLNPTALTKSRIFQSTGLLTVDLLLGGGLPSGSWITLVGAEQSAKSTMAMTILATLAGQIPILIYWDYEGSFSSDYFASIYETLTNNQPDLAVLFGETNNKGWKIQPQIRYYSGMVGETFFNYLAELERLIPDKVFFNSSWWFVYEDTKENREKYEYDKKLFSKTGKLWVPTDTNFPQAVMVVDSYPAMLPSIVDNEESNALAIQARMFSEHLKRVKGRLRNKAITIIGVNQLRMRPATYGNPEYEPGGESLKYYSDCRIKLVPRNVPHGKGLLEEEPSITKGVDVYRYIHLKTIKNKISVPFKEAWLRIWVNDANGIARGFDPVWDTAEYLKLTGQLIKTRKGYQLQMPQLTAHLSWHEFKQLILAKGQQLKSVCQKLGINRRPRIRKWCWEQCFRSSQ